MEFQNPETRFETLNNGWIFFQGKATVYKNVLSKVIWISDSGASTLLDEILGDIGIWKVALEHLDGVNVVVQWFRPEGIEITIQSKKGWKYVKKAMEVYKASKNARRRVRRIVNKMLEEKKAPVVYINERGISIYPLGHIEERIEVKYRRA
ncbi:MAG: hypothetical protein C0177_00475 [Fervidicoccus fontis]|nr:MAG: hypothetical protein C0177_00475 [Fervidicoccus fontis]